MPSQANMSSKASTSLRIVVAIQVAGGILVAAGIVRFFQAAGFTHRFNEAGDYVLVRYYSPAILTLSGLGLLILSLVLPRVRR